MTIQLHDFIWGFPYEWGMWLGMWRNTCSYFKIQITLLSLDSDYSCILISMLSNICLKYETYVISFWFIMQIVVHLMQQSCYGGDWLNARVEDTDVSLGLQISAAELCEALVRTVNIKEHWVLTAFTLGQQPKQRVTQIDFSQVAHV